MWIRDEDGDVHNLDTVSKILVLAEDDEDLHSVILESLQNDGEDDYHTTIFTGRFKACTGFVDMVSTALTVGDPCLDLHDVMRQYPGQNLEQVIEAVYRKAAEERAQTPDEGKN